MTENMKRWFELVSADEELRNGLMALNGLPRDDAVRGIIAKAAEKGIVLTEEEFEVPGNRELSDDELDAVSAGGGCGCPGIGGGNGESTHQDRWYECGCAAFGIGFDSTDDYDCMTHCMCVAIGGGADNPN